MQNSLNKDSIKKMKFNFLNVDTVSRSEQIIIPCILHLVKTESPLRIHGDTLKQSSSQISRHIST